MSDNNAEQNELNLIEDISLLIHNDPKHCLDIIMTNINSYRHNAFIQKLKLDEEIYHAILKASVTMLGNVSRFYYNIIISVDVGDDVALEIIRENMSHDQFIGTHYQCSNRTTDENIQALAQKFDWFFSNQIVLDPKKYFLTYFFAHYTDAEIDILTVLFQYFEATCRRKCDHLLLQVSKYSRTEYFFNLSHSNVRNKN